jgi:hypothetical protein
MAGIVAMGIMPTMIFENTGDLFSTGSTLRAEIAAAAASLIAEEGLDYANAKRKAIERIAGKKHHRLQREILPSNQKMFQSDSQPLRLQALREKALALMQLLADFSPMLTGAVANGTASEHSDIHLHCFAPSAKELGIFLMNQGFDSEADSLAPQRPGGDAIEALAIQWQGELATIAVYPESEQRSSPRIEAKRKHIRLDIKSVEKLLRDNPVQEAP